MQMTLNIKMIVLVITLLSAVFYISTFNLVGEGRDYYYYDILFSEIRRTAVDINFGDRYEPLFYFIAHIFSNLFADNIYIFGSLATISIAIKTIPLFYVNTLFLNYVLILVFYFTRFFPVHELTQIRVALATGFLIAGILFIHNNKKNKALLVFVISIGLHYSSIILILLSLIRVKTIKQLAIASLVGILIFGVPFKLLIHEYGYLLTTLQTYKEQNYLQSSINFLSIGTILDCILIYYGLLIWDKSNDLMRQSLFILISSLILFITLSELPVFAFRLRELTSIVVIVYVFELLKKGTMYRFIATAYIMLSSIYYSYIYLYNEKYFY